MRRRGGESGFTLIEVVIVTAVIVLVTGTLGTFFLAGATPAVASAGRDVTAAFDEARQTAIAFDAATVVFMPAQTGTGYAARVYQRYPGDPAFQSRSGPTYDSTVSISETAAPLGAPGFAFMIDSHGTVTSFANFVASATSFNTRPCPAGGAFVLHLAYAHDTRDMSIPCQLAMSNTQPVTFATPPPGFTPAPFVAQTCPATESCALAMVSPPPGATCPPGYTPDPTAPNLCNAPTSPPALSTPSALPTCPAGYTGAYPTCVSAQPSPTPTPAQKCVPGNSDGMGFASCLEHNPVLAIGPSITRSGCGTRTPVNDPGAQFSVNVDVYQYGSLWGTYQVEFVTNKSPWVDAQDLPPAQTCGLKFTLGFAISSITPESGDAKNTPFVDTGDPSFEHEGVDAISVPPLGASWGSNT